MLAPPRPTYLLPDGFSISSLRSACAMDSTRSMLGSRPRLRGQPVWLASNTANAAIIVRDGPCGLPAGRALYVGADCVGK